MIVQVNSQLSFAFKTFVLPLALTCQLCLRYCYSHRTSQKVLAKIQFFGLIRVLINGIISLIQDLALVVFHFAVLSSF
jgi:hypothetical protein